MLDSKKKCLVVTGPFVPVNEPMTLIPYKQLRLLDYHFDVMVLEDKEDPSLKMKMMNDEMHHKFHLINVGKFQDVLFSINNVNLIKALYHMKKYVNRCVKQFEKDEYEMIYTSSFPAYTHRVGLKAKEIKPKVKWIANFTDPINHSPYKFDDETYRSYSLIEKMAYQAYTWFYVNDHDEVIAFENADILLFICEEQRNFMIEQYLNYNHKISKESLLNKSCIVPLCTIKEWEDIPEKNGERTDIFTMAHFGRIYGLRKIEKFIYAIKELIDEGRLDIEKFQVVQYGEFRKSDLKLIQEINLDECFKIYEKVSYETCLKEMTKSNLLLIFDTIVEDEQWQPYLPSKILEYSLLNKKVFAISPLKSPVTRIMNESKAICARYDVEDIKEKLIKVMSEKQSVIHYNSTNEEAIQGFKERLRGK